MGRVRWPWNRQPPARWLEMCAVGGCGSAATHTRLVRVKRKQLDGSEVWVPLCNPCDLAPIVGFWQALDWVTPEEIEEDRTWIQTLGRPSHADNIALPSGRSWRWIDRPLPEPTRPDPSA
jgi:hypothetical protein